MKLSEEKRADWQIGCVRTEEGVLMRMNGIPRSIAEGLGECYRETNHQRGEGAGVQKVREFLSSSDMATWNRVRPQSSPLSAAEYKTVWRVISGESR